MRDLNVASSLSLFEPWVLTILGLTIEDFGSGHGSENYRCDLWQWFLKIVRLISRNSGCSGAETGKRGHNEHTFDLLDQNRENLNQSVPYLHQLELRWIRWIRRKSRVKRQLCHCVETQIAWIRFDRKLKFRSSLDWISTTWERSELTHRPIKKMALKKDQWVVFGTFCGDILQRV